MTFLTVKEAAKVAKKSEVTLYRAIKNGKLSRSSNGKIDLAKLLRVYPEFNNEITDNEKSHYTTQQNDLHVISLLQTQLAELKADFKQFKVESLEREQRAATRESRLLAMIEYKTQSEKTQSGGGFFSKLFK